MEFFMAMIPPTITHQEKESTCGKWQAEIL